MSLEEEEFRGEIFKTLKKCYKLENPDQHLDLEDIQQMAMSSNENVSSTFINEMSSHLYNQPAPATSLKFLVENIIFMLLITAKKYNFTLQNKAEILNNINNATENIRALHQSKKKYSEKENEEEIKKKNKLTINYDEKNLYLSNQKLNKKIDKFSVEVLMEKKKYPFQPTEAANIFQTEEINIEELPEKILLEASLNFDRVKKELPAYEIFLLIDNKSLNNYPISNIFIVVPFDFHSARNCTIETDFTMELHLTYFAKIHYLKNLKTILLSDFEKNQLTLTTQ